MLALKIFSLQKFITCKFATWMFFYLQHQSLSFRSFSEVYFSTFIFAYWRAHFKLEDIRSLKDILRLGDFMAKLDLKEAWDSSNHWGRWCWMFPAIYFCEEGEPFTLGSWLISLLSSGVGPTLRKHSDVCPVGSFLFLGRTFCCMGWKHFCRSRPHTPRSGPLEKKVDLEGKGPFLVWSSRLALLAKADALHMAVLASTCATTSLTKPCPNRHFPAFWKSPLAYLVSFGIHRVKDGRLPFFTEKVVSASQEDESALDHVQYNWDWYQVWFFLHPLFDQLGPQSTKRCSSI